MPDPEFPDPNLRNSLAEDCRKCPALVAARERICWGVGPREASVLVVGEAPAAGDPEAGRWQGGNWTGMAYTGRRSGRKIRGMIEELGIRDAYYTNAVKCFPSAAIEPGETSSEKPPAETDNREPTSDERANCRPYLQREVAEIDPECVVATGKHATQSLLAIEGRGVDSFLDLVLDTQRCPTLGMPVLPVLHPSYQEVWIPRLGYDYEEYLRAIGETLEDEGVE
ncbi:uracil-DNA glycosylase [Halobacteriales archaeon QS_3_64_16]|nr:MAG: uracil-DNA glycosylase [Halobacteriales archaeon QS_3_64_16]